MSNVTLVYAAARILQVNERTKQKENNCGGCRKNPSKPEDAVHGRTIFVRPQSPKTTMLCIPKPPNINPSQLVNHEE
jgi:hypothetical protein